MPTTELLAWPEDPADVLIGSTFSGYGGLEMGVQMTLGGRAAWHCEFDKAPSAILAHHWPDVPNLGDITRVDWATVPRVHVFTGGSPCQDLSTAGKRKGMKDGTRSGLWVSMREGIAVLRPPVVVWENVRGATSAEATSEVELCAGCVGDEPGVYLRALGRVLGDLADLGYDAQWYGLRAADIGAPHGRFRIFVVATDAEHGGSVRLDAWHAARRARASGRLAFSGDRLTSDSAGEGLEGRAGLDASERRSDATGGRTATDDDDLGPERRGSRAEQDRRPEPFDGSGREATSDDDARGSGRDSESHDLRASRRQGEQPGECASATTADAHGDDRGQQEPGASSELRSRELLLGPAAPARPRGRKSRAQRAAERTERDRANADAAGSGRDGRALEQVGSEVEREASAGSGDGAREHRIVTAREAGIDFGIYARSIQRWELLLGREAPSPVERSKPSKKYPEGKWVLSPAFAEWMMGLPAGHLSDPVIPIDRGARLKAAGNGVVPQQAAHAVLVCLSRAAFAALQSAPSVEQGTADECEGCQERKACKACAEVKPLDAFGVNVHNGKRTPRGVCKDCQRAGRKAVKS